MAASITATVGSASANSYVTTTEFASWAETRQPSTSYDGASADEQVRALISATRRLDQEHWKGVRANETQALQWPRYGVDKPDLAYSVLSGSYFTEDTWYATDEIPQRIKNAQMELAYQFLAGNQSPDDSGLEQYKRVKVASLEIETRAAFKSGDLPEDVAREISPLLKTKPGGVRLLRG